MATPSVNKIDPETYRAIAEQAARENGVDPDLVMRVIAQESAGDPRAVSTAGAQGLMQLMPQTQKDFGVTDPFDATQSVGAGTKLLKQLLDQEKGDTRRALIRYNGGQKAIDAYDAGAPFKETAGYLEGIMGKSDRPAPEKPFDLAALVSDANKSDPGFDLDALVKANPEPGLMDRAISGAKNVGEGLKNAAIETNPFSRIADVATGFGKAAVETGKDLGQAAYDYIPGVKGVTDAAAHGLVNTAAGMDVAPEVADRIVGESQAALSKDLQPTNGLQKTGKFIERGAEFALPGAEADALASTGLRNAPAVLRLIPRMAGQAAVGAAEGGLHGENPVTAGAIAATGPVIGETVGALAPIIKASARGMVRTSLKPAYSLLAKMGGFEGAAPHADELVDFIIKHNLASPEEAEAFIKELENQKIIPAMADATKRGVTVPGAVTKVVKGIQDFRNAPSLAPADIQSAADSTLAKVRGGDLFEDVAVPGTGAPTVSPILGPNGQSIVTPGAPVLSFMRAPKYDITPDELLNAARNTKFTPTTVGTKLSPQDEVNNRVVAIARDELKKAVPESVPAFEEERMAINAKKALDRYDVREGNTNQVPLQTVVGTAGHAAAGNAFGIGAAVLRLVGGVKSGLLANQLAEALARNDVRGVTSIVRMMGYGAALDALPKEAK